jgi:hypothetical protein
VKSGGFDATNEKYEQFLNMPLYAVKVPIYREGGLASISRTIG